MSGRPVTGEPVLVVRTRRTLPVGLVHRSRLVHGGTEKRGNLTVGLDVVDEQRTTGGVRRAEEQTTGLRGQRPTIQHTTAGGNSLVRSNKTGVGVTVDANRSGTGEGVEVGTRGRVATKDGRVKLPAEGLRETTNNLVVQGCLVAAELVREGDDEIKATSWAFTHSSAPGRLRAW